MVPRCFGKKSYPALLLISLISDQKKQNLSKWDNVFIPINENNSHWYSACINFRLKRIDIYDSLREICLTNRQKPVQLRKNTHTMLVCLDELLNSFF